MNEDLDLATRVKAHKERYDWYHYREHSRHAVARPTVRLRTKLIESTLCPAQTITANCAERDGPVEVNSIFDSCSSKGDWALNNLQEKPEASDGQLSRYRGVLSFVAYRVLNDHDEAEDAVRSCLLSASNNVPRFECEGAFRSWLVRMLIDEALLILHKKRTRSNNTERIEQCQLADGNSRS